eukprot:2972053-Pyramimonas_sp.AAC.1
MPNLSLEYLTVGGGQLGSGISLPIGAMMRGEALTHIRSCTDGIGSAEAILLARALTVFNGSLDLLDLNCACPTFGNDIGDEGAKAIAEALKVTKCSLKSLDLYKLGFSLVTVLVTVGSVQAERGVDLNVNEGERHWSGGGQGNSRGPQSVQGLGPLELGQ